MAISKMRLYRPNYNFYNYKSQYLKLLLAHHPLCGFYEDNFYRIGKIKFCKGCTAGYSGIIFMLFLWIFGIIPQFLIFRTLIGYFEIILIIAIIAILYDNQKKKKIIPRFPVRFLMGIASFTSLYTVFVIEPWYDKIPVIIFIILMINLIGLFRYKKLIRVCNDHCDNRRFDWCDYALGTRVPPELVELKLKSDIV